MENDKRSTGRFAKYLWLISALVIMMLAVYLPLPESLLTLDNAQLSAPGRVSIGVMLFCLVLWISEPVPFHITGFLGMILLALFKAGSFPEVIRLGFGNDTLIFFIGVLIISACVTRSGLGQRLSLLVLRLTGNKTHHILLGMLIAGAVISMWLTTLAAAALLVPLALSIAREAGLKKGKSAFGKALFIAVVWGSLLGGPATPAGSGANPLALGFIREMLGIELSFTDWMVYGIPCMLALILPAWGILLLFFKPEIKTLGKSSEDLKRDYLALPPLSRDEKSTLAIFLLTVLLWLTGKPLGRLLGMSIPTSLPAILGGCLFFLPGVSSVTWDEVQKDISWSGILLIGSGISLGMLMYQSGAAQWLATLLLSNIASLSAFSRILAVILIVSALKLGLSSNTVTATVVIPIMIALAGQQGLSPLGLVIPAAMSMNAAYILVTSSPTGVIPYSTGWFSIRDMALPGILMTLAATGLTGLVLYLIGLFTGIY